MRQRASWGLIGRIRFVFRARPVLAVAVTALSLLIVASAITFTTALRCGPAKALGLKSVASGCVTVGSVAINASASPTYASGKGGPSPLPPFGNPASNPYYNPASGPYPGNQASGPYPPQGNGASPGGPYPPFYAPASNGTVQASWPVNCSLPVFAGPPGSGGFIVYPGGSFIVDQSSSVTLPATSPSAPPVGGPGPGYGYTTLSYDHQASRWLPVGVNQVSPDGSHYAFPGTDGIYVVEVATGKMSEIGEGHPWAIVAVQADGVYAGDPSAGGLWTLPFSGTPRQVTKSGYWRVASKTAAYGTATSAVPQGANNVIQRLDIATGVAVDWFSRPGTQSSVTGLDGKGNPIINVFYLNNSGNEIWIATGPTTASAIAGVGNLGGGGFSSFNTPVADSHGIWFTGSYSGGYGNQTNGIALYVAGSGFYWMSGYGAQLAGGCY